MRSVWLLLCASCAAHVVYDGHTPDRAERARVLEDSGPFFGAQRVIVGERADPSFDAIGADELALAGSARAYPALEDGRWVLVRDGKVQPGAWDAIADVRLSPSGAHLAATVLARGAWRALVDGALGPGYEAIDRGTLAVSDDGRASYVARRGERAWVVLGARELGPYLAVRDLMREPLAFVVAVPGGARVYEDGHESATFDEVLEHTRSGFVARRGDRVLVFVAGVRVHEGRSAGALSTDGARFAFASLEEDGEHLVTERGSEAVPYEAIAATSVGEGHVAYVARAPNGAALVIDGAERGRFAWVTPPIFARGRFAYVASMGAGALLAHDRGRDAFDVVLPDTVVIDARGRVGAMVGYASNRSLWIAVDGRPRVRVDLEELAGEALRGAYGGSRRDVRPWVLAEMARL